MTSQEIKSLELNEKIEYFRNIFSNLNNENEFDILNIFRLVNSYNTFDDDFFDHEGSYITDIAEFIDIKMALEEEINNFSVELIKWYFSLLYSCDIKTDNSDSDSFVEIPMLIYGFFVNATIPVMSTIMNNIDMSEIDLTNLQKVKGAFILMSKMFQTHSFVASFINKM